MMSKKVETIVGSAIAGICVGLFLLCFHDLTAPAGTPRAISSFGCRVIPIVLAICVILFARRLLEWKSHIKSVLTAIPLLVAFYYAASVSSYLIGKLFQRAGWGDVAFTSLHGMDGPVMLPFLHSALAGVLMSVYCFLALSWLRGLGRSRS